ncbi:hypothetical protein D9M70_579490 [compost metagenome]
MNEENFDLGLRIGDLQAAAGKVALLDCPPVRILADPAILGKTKGEIGIHPIGPVGVVDIDQIRRASVERIAIGLVRFGANLDFRFVEGGDKAGTRFRFDPERCEVLLEESPCAVSCVDVG